MTCLAATALSLAAGSLDAQVLQRHVAEFRFGAEQSTTATAAAFPGPPDGALIYFRNFFLPATEKTVYITLSTTGDAHNGVAHWFSARINGQVCNKGDEGAGFAPPGWIPLQKHFDYENITYRVGPTPGLSGGDGGGGNGDMHDNGIYYTWCCPASLLLPGANNRVEIKMATSHAGFVVFVERSHYYVDSTNNALCTQAAPIPTPVPTAIPPEPTASGPASDAAGLNASQANRQRR